MASKAAPKDDATPKADTEKKAGTSTPRRIPGNLPYLPASGTLKKALDNLIEASRPPKFNADFLENVLKLKGGSARATIPILKRLGFLNSDGVPTDLYARFRTESGRGEAAYQALRNGFPEIFKRSEYAHTVEEGKLKDIILEITGLKSSDQVAQAIKATFNVVKSFIPSNLDVTGIDEEGAQEEGGGSGVSGGMGGGSGGAGADAGANAGNIRLAYNINIVLPETSDLQVLNAIFRSIKENLMR